MTETSSLWGGFEVAAFRGFGRKFWIFSPPRSETSTLLKYLNSHHAFSLEKLREEGTDEDAPSEYPADDCSEKTSKFPFVLGSKEQGEVDGCRHWDCQSLIVK